MSTPAANFYAESYGGVAEALPGSALEWLNLARRGALDRFARTGFPSPREEEWKYTNVSALEQKLYAPPRDRGTPSAAICKPLIDHYALPGAHLLVFVDGWFASEWSSREAMADGLRIGSLANALDADPACVETLFQSHDDESTSAFVAFNKAYFTDGILLRLECNIAQPGLVQCLYLATRPALYSLRNIVSLADGAEARVVETYASLLDDGYLTAAVTTVDLASNSSLELTKMQVEGSRAFHFGGTYARQARSSRMRFRSYGLGSQLARAELCTTLSLASECKVEGLVVAAGTQHLDHHVRVDHLEAQAQSQVTFKGIVDDSARGVFQGRIVVHPDAQKTDAEMSCRNLLLSPTAEVDAKPQLEIHADDVKCSHGVTVGQLSEDSLFYMVSRGIDLETARGLLTYGFANAMLESVSDVELKTLLGKLLQARLAVSEGMGVGS